MLMSTSTNIFMRGKSSLKQPEIFTESKFADLHRCRLKEWGHFKEIALGSSANIHYSILTMFLYLNIV